MSQPLPTGNFRWIDPKKFNHKSKKTNHIIECDLEYPKELHDLHSDCPLAPEKLVVKDEWLSPTVKNLKRNLT